MNKECGKAYENTGRLRKELREGREGRTQVANQKRKPEESNLRIVGVNDLIEELFTMVNYCRRSYHNKGLDEWAVLSSEKYSGVEGMSK